MGENRRKIKLSHAENEPKKKWKNSTKLALVSAALIRATDARSSNCRVMVSFGPLSSFL